MDTKKEAKKYLNKYFKQQYLEENDHEFKSLVRLLNKAQKQVKNCSIPVVIKSVCKHCGNKDYSETGICGKCFEIENGLQTVL